MSDLISRKALLEFASNHKDKTVDMNDIARFPTAYDVDKVVERLDKVSEHYECDNAPNGTDSQMLFLVDAIEIVREGAVKDE